MLKNHMTVQQICIANSLGACKLACANRAFWSFADASVWQGISFAAFVLYLYLLKSVYTKSYLVMTVCDNVKF